MRAQRITPTTARRCHLAWGDAHVFPLSLLSSRFSDRRKRVLDHPLFINTVLLGGSSEQKIAAAGAAGFAQVELWRQDVDPMPGGGAGAVRMLERAGVGLTDFQVLLDFDGAPNEKRASKRAEALQMLDMAAALGAGTLLAPASTDPACDAARVVDDLAWLAQEAARRGLRVAYEGMAWSTVNATLPAAWRSVREAGQPNLGLVVDAFHLFARGRDAEDLDGIPAEGIFLVQLSDLDHLPDRAHVVDQARHCRLLPGAGRFPLAGLLRRLAALGYAGPIGLEVFNDALKARDPGSVAREAMAALKKVLGEAGMA